MQAAKQKLLHSSTRLRRRGKTRSPQKLTSARRTRFRGCSKSRKRNSEESTCLRSANRRQPERHVQRTPGSSQTPPQGWADHQLLHERCRTQARNLWRLRRDESSCRGTYGDPFERTARAVDYGKRHSAGAYRHGSVPPRKIAGTYRPDGEDESA